MNGGMERTVILSDTGQHITVENNTFARSILEKRRPEKGTLEHPWQVTRIFEAFAEGPGRQISL